MSKLLTAGFSRVFKKKTFYICLIIMAVNGVLNALSIYSDKALGYNSTLDSIFFEYVPFIPILMSVFCALFIGTEYSDGTMRNKIVSGHKRSTIYLSNFIICAAAGLMMCGAYFITYLGLGIPLVGFFTEAIIALVGCSAALLLAVTGIFTLIALTVKSKSASAVISIILAFTMIFVAGILYSLLQQPEYYHEYGYIGMDYQDDATSDNYEFGLHMEFNMEEMNPLDSDNNAAEPELIPNPSYISGVKRQIYQFILDFTPGGQAILISSRDVSNPLLLAGYSIIISVVTTAAGLIKFNKMNLN